VAAYFTLAPQSRDPGYLRLEIPPQVSLRGFFLLPEIGWITGGACFHLQNIREAMTDRRPPSSGAIFDLPAVAGRASPTFALCRASAAPVPKGRVICYGRRPRACGCDGRRPAERQLSSTNLALRPSRLNRHRNPPAMAMAVPDAADQGDRSRPSGGPNAGWTEGRGTTGLQLAQEADVRRSPAWCCCRVAALRNWIAPADGVSFRAEAAGGPGRCLRSGAGPIGEVNTVRKHLSRIKGRAGSRRAGERARPRS